MTAIPRPALVLGLAGLGPFALGAGLALTGASLPVGSLALPADGAGLLSHYGIIILCFMSGTLWGFATRGGEDRAALGYGLSVLPALWALFAAGGPAQAALPALTIGFVALLPLDWMFLRWGLAPAWWIRLRLLLTGGVVLCLAAGIATA
jgi:hypothetical protein